MFVSDLRRAVQTAELAFAGSGISIHQGARLRECNDGALNGAPLAQVAAERARRTREPFPDGQSYQQAVAQTRVFLQELAAGWDGRTVLVIAHSANRWALDCLLNGRALEDLVDAPSAWQPGWTYTLPSGWTGAG